jgi:hypothetical protein
MIDLSFVSNSFPAIGGALLAASLLIGLLASTAVLAPRQRR